MRAGIFLAHVTLTTGHVRRSYRSEVGDEILAVMAPWLAEALRTGDRRSLPVPGLDRYSASAHRVAGALILTVFGDDLPLVTLGVAQRSRQASELWPYLVAQFGAADGVLEPETPWCAVSLRRGLVQFPDAAEWLGDFERCIAWAWITRAPNLEVIQ